MSEVAAAAGDGVFGPTSERGNGGRWTATATLRRRQQMLALLLISSLLQIVTYDFLQIFQIAIWKSFGFFFFYLLKILFPLVGSQNGSVLGNLCFTSVHILSGESLFCRLPA